MATAIVPARRAVAGYLAGALAVLIAHQPMLALLNALHLTHAAIYSLRPTAPLHVPQLVWLCFWWGWWGVVLAAALQRFPRGAAYWLAAFAFGAVLPTLVGWFVVAPLEGLAPGPFTARRIAVAVLANGAWAIGAALVFRALVRGGPPARTRAR